MKTTHGAGRIGGTRLVLAVFLLAANYGWGSNGACSTDPSYTQVTSYGSGTSAGCYATDKTFSNFVDQGGTNLSLADVYVAGAESGYTNGLGAYTVSALFSASPTGAAWTAGPSVLVQEKLSFVADSANTYSFDSAYPTGLNSSITSIALSGSGDAALAALDGVVEVVQDICIGTSNCSNFIQLSLVDQGGTVFTQSCVSPIAGATCLSNQAAVAFSGPVTSLFVATTFSANGPIGPGSAGEISSLNYFEDTFGEVGVAPEPSTFVLMGSALAVLAALRLRK